MSETAFPVERLRSRHVERLRSRHKEGHAVPKIEEMQTMRHNDALPFKSLFSTLRAADYYWSPLSPDRWKRARADALENPQRFDPWVRCFGLGLEVPEDEFEHADLNPFTQKIQGRLSSTWGVSRIPGSDDVFIAHSHWDGERESHAYIGQETSTLIDFIKGHSFQGSRVLDLGCGAGALSLSIATRAHQVLGLDCSETATRLALASARAQGFYHLDFQRLAIGSAEAESYVRARGLWDVAVMNPPMAIPEFSSLHSAHSRPERDGGRLGIELPLLFLDFAHRHLVKDAPLFMLATNPMNHTSRDGLFFEALQSRFRAWAVDEATCIDRRFNQALARKHRYAEQGIERVELWILKLSNR